MGRRQEGGQLLGLVGSNGSVLPAMRGEGDAISKARATPKKEKRRLIGPKPPDLQPLSATRPPADGHTTARLQKVRPSDLE
jgi:hypothetical protein